MGGLNKTIKLRESDHEPISTNRRRFESLSEDLRSLEDFGTL